MYANVKDAYISSPLPISAGHTIISYISAQLIFLYKTACGHRDIRKWSAGAPQRTVLSPFTLYTNDFNYCMETCHLQKFSDDSAVVGCNGGDEVEYRATADDLVVWCECNHLQLNLKKRQRNKWWI